jgi:tetratricopeptide (TPR) repeat protein
MPDFMTEEQLHRLIALAKKGRYSDVLEALATCEIDPEEDRVLGGVAGLELVCLARQHDYDATGDRLDTLFKQAENRSNLLLGAGLLCSDLGVLDVAETLLTHLSQCRPESHVPSYNLGIVLAQADQHEEAVECYDQSLQREYRHAPSYQHKAVSLRLLGRLTEAATAYRQYLNLEPEDPEVWVTLGETEGERGAYEAAFEAFDRARELHPGSITLHYYEAATALFAGDRPRLEFCTSALESMAPEIWPTHMAQAFMSEFDGDMKGAWEHAMTAVDRAALTDEDDIVSHVVETAIEMGRRHHLDNECRTFVEDALTRDLVVSPILDADRAYRNRVSDQARCYAVIIDAKITDDRMVRALGRRDGDDRKPFFYLKCFVLC